MRVVRLLFVQAPQRLVSLGRCCLRQVTLPAAVLVRYLLQLEQAMPKVAPLFFSLLARLAVQRALVALRLLLVVLVVLVVRWICVPARAKALVVMLCSQAVMYVCLPVMARHLAVRLPSPQARTLQAAQALV